MEMSCDTLDETLREILGEVLILEPVISAYQLDATDFDSPTGGQFQCMALDPDSESDDSMGLFRIAESQLFPYAQR